uniref:uncharacterized protein LOC100178887 isoform X2 n=1 Tax=Ciona intestinalis TaxID=7719 RepID=UPI000EF478CF|nr:uncharacterized protein LOC100178887 isoform X2 [Ciona intestinalis]|eukprot:XP_026689951.1 uncharacterized protein LOC100178887 isoform X2 [Ciona intestinalis]
MLPVVPHLPVFVGSGPGGTTGELTDVQQVTTIGKKVVISARNSIYVFDPQSFTTKNRRISFEQILRWYPQNDTNCYQRTTLLRNCQNYIRVVTPITPNAVLVCGTNSARPTCREYEWLQGKFNKNFQESQPIERFKVPYDDATHFAYTYSNGYLFSALRTDLLRSNPSIARSPVTDPSIIFPRSPSIVGSSLPLPRLTTDEASRWLGDPRFVGMVDTMEKVFIFFREEAVEASDQTDKVIFSRVGQVCKNDEGGSYSLLRNKWTTFFKARLNCSIPGDRPFYFNEIQHVTQPIDLNGQMTVFATMTTPENSIPGSAVCAYTMHDIARAMAGNFKERDQTSGCWKNSPNNPRPHSAQCRTQPVRAALTLKFIKEHTIMSESVQPLGGSAIFTRTQTQDRFTAIAVETNLNVPNHHNVSVIYIGTDQGNILKVSASGLGSDRTRNTSFSEIWQVYSAEECGREEDRAEILESRNQRRVRSITLVPNSDVILVAFSRCVVSVPKRFCKAYTCKRSCIQSGNPYCAWQGGECKALTTKSSQPYEQDLFAARTDLPPCNNDKETDFATTGQFQCADTASVVLPLVVSLVSVFCFVLLIFLIIVKCRAKRQLRRSARNCTTTLCQKENAPHGMGRKNKEAETRRFFCRRPKKDYPPRVSIEPSSARSHPSERSNDSVFEGIQEPLNNAAHASRSQNAEFSNLHIVENFARPSQDSMDEGSAWSEDIFDSDSQTPNHQNPQQNTNNNRTVGVAHVMNRKPGGKLSQIVRPTFVTKSKVKMGSHQSTDNYGSTQDHPVRRSSTPPRIVTNPNYLPISPFVKRSTVPDLYENQNFIPLDEHDYENIEGSTIPRDDSNFPPPPPCVLSPSADVSSPPLFSTLPVSTSWYPSPPEESENKTPEPRSSLGETTPLTQQSSGPRRSLAISSSASGDSTSSGFVSSSFSSPPSSFKEKPGSSRKAFIVAKGILTAQTFASTRGSKKSRKKKGSQDANVIKYSLSEREEDDVFSPEETREEDSSSQSLKDLEEEDINNFRSPEYHEESSEEEGFSENSPTTPSERLTPSESNKSKLKKSIRLFKLKKNKRNKKEKMNGTLMPDVETFMSPAYDEDPVVPTVVGWKEIEYTSPTASYEYGSPTTNTSSFKSPSKNEDFSHYNGRSYDDTCLPRDSNQPPSEPYAFYTMRPKHRMRQSMPKMRNTDKSWARTNNPLPVPTPAVPDII